MNVDADVLDRVLRHLAVKGVLSRAESGRYALTAPGEALRDDHPSGLRAMLDIESAIGRADLSFVQLLHSVRTGEPAFPVQFGRPFWDDLSADPVSTASYDAQMGSDVAADAPAIDEILRAEEVPGRRDGQRHRPRASRRSVCTSR